MSDTASEELQGFDVAARRAVALAEVEARELAHDRVGTEHLLLGLLVNEGSNAAGALADAGVTLAAARRKVSEAVGSPPDDGRRPSGPLPKSPRAVRALGRAARFAHARRADAVGTEHVLLGVLDVEGTAGQVLRGLGFDVERLRASLDGPVALSQDLATAAPTLASKCPSCAIGLDGALGYRVITATGEGLPPIDALVFSCTACGMVVGVSAASADRQPRQDRRPDSTK
jgi:hypothetical protein